MTGIWYEVFPVTLVTRHTMLLQASSAAPYAPWLLPHQPHMHPNALVLDYLASVLGGLPQPEKTIVHSTSWRYEPDGDRILLTYLAILPQGYVTAAQAHLKNLALIPIGEITSCYGDQLFPPAQIERCHVLAHALDHLAALNTYDPTIQTALEHEWQDILRQRQPRPAGGLPHSLALAGTLAR
jgi:hypothetical protein